MDPRQLHVLGKRPAEYADGPKPGARMILCDGDGRAGPKRAFRVDRTINDRSGGLAADVTDWGRLNRSPVRLWTGPGKANQSWSRG